MLLLPTVMSGELLRDSEQESSRVRAHVSGESSGGSEERPGKTQRHPTEGCMLGC